MTQKNPMDNIIFFKIHFSQKKSANSICFMAAVIRTIHTFKTLRSYYNELKVQIIKNSYKSITSKKHKKNKLNLLQMECDVKTIK